MVRRTGVALAVLALLGQGQGSAFAAAYNFDVLYFGSGVASLAAGSDNPTDASLLAGDSFDYKLTAQNGGAWTIVNSTNFFPFFAFYVAECDTRTGDFTLTLNRHGASVFSYSEVASLQSCVHLGTNVVAPPTGLVYDQYDLTYSLASVSSGTGASTPLSILPYPGVAPELNPFFPTEGGAITYSAPEPNSAGLMLAALLGLGFALRRRRAGGSA